MTTPGQNALLGLLILGIAGAISLVAVTIISLNSERESEVLSPSELARRSVENGRSSSLPVEVVGHETDLNRASRAEKAEHFLVKAESAIVRGHYSDARLDCLHALEFDTGNVKARLRLGYVLRKMGRMRDAEKQYDALLEQGEDSEEIRGALLDISRDLGDLKGIVAHAQALTVFRPRDPSLPLLVSSACRQLMDLEPAATAARNALSLAPESPAAMVELALVLEMQRKPQAADKLLAAALEQTPGESNLAERIREIRKRIAMLLRSDAQ